MTALWLKALGMGLLILAGAGGGWSLYRYHLSRWRAVCTFIRLLELLRETIYYRALPCEEALSYAASDPAFAAFHLERCRTYAEIPMPQELERTCGPELREGLSSLSSASRSSACRTLASLCAICRRTETEFHAKAEQTKQTAPRLGGCLGLLAAILLA